MATGRDVFVLSADPNGSFVIRAILTGYCFCCGVTASNAYERRRSSRDARKSGREGKSRKRRERKERTSDDPPKASPGITGDVRRSAVDDQMMMEQKMSAKESGLSADNRAVRRPAVEDQTRMERKIRAGESKLSADNHDRKEGAVEDQKRMEQRIKAKESGLTADEHERRETALANQQLMEQKIQAKKSGFSGRDEEAVQRQRREEEKIRMSGARGKRKSARKERSSTDGGEHGDGGASGAKDGRRERRAQPSSLDSSSEADAVQTRAAPRMTLREKIGMTTAVAVQASGEDVTDTAASLVPNTDDNPSRVPLGDARSRFRRMSSTMMSRRRLSTTSSALASMRSLMVASVTLDGDGDDGDGRPKGGRRRRACIALGLTLLIVGGAVGALFGTGTIGGGDEDEVVVVKAAVGKDPEERRCRSVGVSSGGRVLRRSGRRPPRSRSFVRRSPARSLVDEGAEHSATEHMTAATEGENSLIQSSIAAVLAFVEMDSLEERYEAAIGTVTAEVLASELDPRLQKDGVELHSVDPEEAFLLKDRESDAMGNEIAVVMAVKALVPNSNISRMLQGSDLGFSASKLDNIIQEIINRESSKILRVLSEYNRVCREQKSKGLKEDDYAFVASTTGKVKTKEVGMLEDSIDDHTSFSTACSDDLLVPEYFETSLEGIELKSVSEVDSLKCVVESGTKAKESFATASSLSAPRRVPSAVYYCLVLLFGIYLGT